MAKKSARTSANRAAPVKGAAKVDGKIVGGVWHKGKTYGPGDEAALAAAGVPKVSMQRLCDEGVIIGFGYTQSAADDETTDETSDTED